MEVARRKAGSYFGEGALLTNEPRNSDVVAETDLKLLKLGVEEFNSLLGSLRELMDRQFVFRCLRPIEVLKPLTDDDLLKIVDVIETLQFTDGDNIVTQGDVGDSFYIIKDGQVKCTRKEESGELLEIVRPTLRRGGLSHLAIRRQRSLRAGQSHEL